MERFAREDVWEVLRQFGVTHATRATTTDPTEEVIILAERDFESVDVTALTTASMEALPHTKVWVVKEHPRWSSEPL
jgi:hypothetical protein